MSKPRFPMTYHGDLSKETPAETALLDEEIARFSEQFNTIPGRLRVAFVGSILMSACMGQEDPEAALEFVVAGVVDAMKLQLAKPGGAA